jgi:hypothetical protein
MRFCRRTGTTAIAGPDRKRGCAAPPPRIVFQIGLGTKEKGGRSEKLSDSLKKGLLICRHLQQFSKIISPPNRPFPRPDNVNGMRNPAPIKHFPPTLFSPNCSPIYEEAHLLRKS